MVIRKLAAPVLALSLALGAVTVASKPADAGRNGRIAAGVAAGIIGLGILGAYANARDRGHCYHVGGGCHWREGNCFYNRYGDYICRRGYQVCEPRRLVCN